MQRDTHLLSGIGNGMAAGALWGLVFLAPQLLAGFSPAQQSVGRYAVYGVLALLLLLPRRGVLSSLGAREWGALVWLSLAGNLLYYVLLSQAVRLAGGAATSLIVGLIPVVVTLVGAREAGKAMLKRLAAPLLLCCAGVGLIAYQALQAGHGGQAPGTGLAGIGCAFGALACWSAYAVGNSRAMVRLAHVSAHEWSLLTGVVTGALAGLLGLFAFPAAHGAAEWGTFWGVSAAVAVFASIIGNRCWNQASRLLPLTLTGQMIVFETLFALVYSFLWEHRPPTGLEGAAIACLLLGITGCASAHRRVGEASQ